METTGKRIAERKSQGITTEVRKKLKENEEEGGSRERRRCEPQEESRTAERQQGARVTKHPGTQAKKEQETPRSNKSWRQVETTPQPKEQTVQRTVTPQEEGEGAGDGKRKQWRKATRKEKSHGGRPVANQKGETRRDEMEENPSRRTTE